jgi:tripartite-type tricarboxylate transporter receptor subunit TctC
MPYLNNRTSSMVGIVGALAALLTAGFAFAAADAFPTRPMRLIVAVSPGGSNDFVARLIAGKLTERLAEQVVVVNRAGAGGLIGYEGGARATPDGYTLVLASTAYATVAATRKTPYDPIKDLATVAKLGTGPFLLVSNASVPATSLKELIALAKQKPGQLIMASGEIASGPHLGSLLFLKLTKTDFRVVPFKGGGPALIDLLGGHSHAGFNNIVQAMPHIASGKLRALANGGAKRSVVLSDVPTVAEAADLPGYENANWWSILAPTGTPAAIVSKLTNEIRTILSQEDVQKWFVNAGGEVDYLGPTDMRRFLQQEIEKYRKIAKETNVQVD